MSFIQKLMVLSLCTCGSVGRVFYFGIEGSLVRGSQEPLFLFFSFSNYIMLNIMLYIFLACSFYNILFSLFYMKNE